MAIDAKSQAVCPCLVATSTSAPESISTRTTSRCPVQMVLRRSLSPDSCWPRLQPVHEQCREILMQLQSTKVTSSHHSPCLLQRQLQPATVQNVCAWKIRPSSFVHLRGPLKCLKSHCQKVGRGCTMDTHKNLRSKCQSQKRKRMGHACSWLDALKPTQ